MEQYLPGLCSSFFHELWVVFLWFMEPTLLVFYSKPSSSIQVQIVESERWIPSRSSKVVCNRSRIQSLNGYPSVFGFCNAKLISALRTAWLWVGGRPARERSCRPVKPSSLNRLITTLNQLPCWQNLLLSLHPKPSDWDYLSLTQWSVISVKIGGVPSVTLLIAWFQLLLRWLIYVTLRLAHSFVPPVSTRGIIA